MTVTAKLEGSGLVCALILGRGYKVAVEMSTERLSHRDHISFYSLLVPHGAKWRPGSLSYQELSEGKGNEKPSPGPKGKPRLASQMSRNLESHVVTG